MTHITSAQTPTPTERLTAATALSALDAPGIRPWHLLLDVTLFDDAGKNPNVGTIEVWHREQDSLVIFKFGAASESVLTVANGVYRSSSGTNVPPLAMSVLDGFIHPGPNPADLSDAKPELRKEMLGKTSVDCVMLTRPFAGVFAVPLGLFATYCMQRDKDSLLASYAFGGHTLIRNRLGSFLDHEITTELTLKEKTTIVATATMKTLKTFEPAAEFEPTADLKQGNPTRARISSGVMRGMRLTSIAPQYPVSARMAHISGSVVLRAVVGRDGHVREIQPITGPDPDLMLSAIQAVRQWTYKPYLLNGEPVEADTTVVVNYNLSP